MFDSRFLPLAGLGLLALTSSRGSQARISPPSRKPVVAFPTEEEMVKMCARNESAFVHGLIDGMNSDFVSNDGTPDEVAAHLIGFNLGQYVDRKAPQWSSGAAYKGWLRPNETPKVDLVNTMRVHRQNLARGLWFSSGRGRSSAPDADRFVTDLGAYQVISDGWEHFRAKGSTARISQRTQLHLYHGAQRLSLPLEVRPHKKGHAEYGPGIYLTTSWETARKYSKGGGKVYDFIFDSEPRWLEDASVPYEVAVEFVNSLHRLPRRDVVLDSLKRLSRGTGHIRLTYLNNVFVNEGLSSGQHGPALAAFFVKHGVDASLVTQGSEDWVVLFNPSIVREVVPVEPKQVKSGFAFDLPRPSQSKSKLKPTVGSAARMAPIRYVEPDGAGVLFVIPSVDPWVLLVRRSKSVPSPGLYSVPGGQIEVGEMPITAAYREVEEELGSPGVEHMNRPTDSYVWGGGSPRRHYTTFLVIPKGRQAFGPTLNSENDHAYWVRASQVDEMLATGTYIGNPTWSGQMHPAFAEAWRGGLREKVLSAWGV